MMTKTKTMMRTSTQSAAASRAAARSITRNTCAGLPTLHTARARRTCSPTQARLGGATRTVASTSKPASLQTKPTAFLSGGRSFSTKQQPSLRQSSSTRRQRHMTTKAGGGAGGGVGTGAGKQRALRSPDVDSPWKAMLVISAFGYMSAVLFIPLLNVFSQAFANGPGPFVENLTDEDFLHAMKMTFICAGIAVPVNTAFGLVAALWLARTESKFKPFLLSALDVPFSISPVVTGLMLVLLYGRNGWFAPILAATDFKVVFALPGIALATLFVTMPFVAREVIPVLEEMDRSQEEAARAMGANEFEVFWSVTLPNIRFGVMYGMVLTNARAMGEFGAVSVISGNILGKTQTLTQYVESMYKEYQTESAFSAAVVLSLLAFLTLFLKEWLERQAESEDR